AVANQPASASAFSRTRCSPGAACVTISCARAKRSGAPSARTAVSTSSAGNRRSGTPPTLRDSFRRTPGQQLADEQPDGGACEPGDRVGLQGGGGHQEQDGGDDRGAQQVALVVLPARAPDEGREGPRAQPGQRGAVAARH